MTLPGRPRVQAVSTHRRVELRDGWQLCSTEPGVATNPRWLASTGAVGTPAVVPGTVAEAMRCAGGLDLEHAPNFDERDWWYRCRIDVEPNEDIDATVLRFDGLATLADVWLNDRLVLERTCARGADVLLVFSEGDPGLDFVQRRHAREVRLLERRRSNFAMRIVRGADHTLTRLEARARLMHLLTTHLVARHRG